MARWGVVFLFAAVVLAQGDDSDVLELDADTFDDAIGVPIMLVEFYAPWCGHCKRLAPEYETAATALIENDPPIILAKVDCPANTDLCGQFGVSGYPTLKIFRDGQFSADYQGPRSADGIISYMKKQAGPSVKELPGIEELRVFIENEEHSVIGFFSGNDKDAISKFKSEAAKMRDDFRFGLTTNAEALTEFNYQDQVVIFRPPAMKTKLEESEVVVAGENLKSFIEENFVGLAGVRDTDSAKFFEKKKPLAVVYFDVDYVRNSKGSNYWRNRVLKVAKDFVGEVNFAVSDKDDYTGELQALGLDSESDVVVGLYDQKGQKYAMTDKFSVDSLKSFVQQFLNDELEPYIKSEPIPDNDGPVQVVVGKNFNDIVDGKRDVLLEFYAPWCGHCKALAPKFDELGEKLKNDPNVVIAKSDATSNDYPPGYEVRGYPTIYWIPAGGKPEKYEGGREVADFIEFIKKNASNPVIVDGEEEKKKKKKKKKQEL